MSENVSIALITAASMLFAGIVPLAFQAIQRRSENRRWLAEPYRARRFEALVGVHLTLAECKFSVVAPSDGGPDPKQWWESASLRKDAANKALVVAFPYLAGTDRDTLVGVAGSYEIAIKSSRGTIAAGGGVQQQTKEKADADLKDFLSRYRDGEAVLARYLNPKFLSSLEN